MCITPKIGVDTNLEEIFTQLVEQHDMESRAQEIASVITW